MGDALHPREGAAFHLLAIIKIPFKNRLPGGIKPNYTHLHQNKFTRKPERLSPYNRPPVAGVLHVYNSSSWGKQSPFNPLRQYPKETALRTINSHKKRHCKKEIATTIAFKPSKGRRK
jgi:hypothetical protein